MKLSPELRHRIHFNNASPSRGLYNTVGDSLRNEVGQRSEHLLQVIVYCYSLCIDIKSIYDFVDVDKKVCRRRYLVLYYIVLSF